VRSVLKTTALLIVPGLLASLLSQACGSGPAHAQQADVIDPIEGVWSAQVTIRDCSSGSTVRTFRGLQMFGHGGQLTATNNGPTVMQGPSLGVWQKGSGSGQYTATFRFFRYNADGTFAGSQRVTRTIQLSGDQFTSTISAQVLDPNDQVLQTICGTEASSRGP
jgi:hypothetical protein